MTAPDGTALLTARCPLCAWYGTTDAETCPRCGHGLLEYTLQRVDPDD